MIEDIDFPEVIITGILVVIAIFILIGLFKSLSVFIKYCIKEILRTVIREEIKRSPLIISSRAPCDRDIYEVGTTWLHGSDKYIAKKVTIDWHKEE